MAELPSVSWNKAGRANVEQHRLKSKVCITRPAATHTVHTHTPQMVGALAHALPDARMLAATLLVVVIASLAWRLATRCVRWGAPCWFTHYHNSRWCNRRRKPGCPPGPRTIPLFGDAVIKLIAEGSRYHRRMFATWGPTFSDTVAGSRVVFISRHEDVKKVLGSEHELVKGETPGHLLLGWV